MSKNPQEAIDLITYHCLEYKKKAGHYPAEMQISNELFLEWSTNIYFLDRYNNLAFFDLSEDKQVLSLEDINYILEKEGLPTRIVIQGDKENSNAQ